MSKTFNKPEKAAELKLGIIDIPVGEPIIKVNIKDIPLDCSVEDFVQLIKDEGIMIIDV